MKSKSIKLLIITLPIFVIGFFVNIFVNDNNSSTLIERAHADVPLNNGSFGGFGCCEGGGPGCEGGEGSGL